MTTQGWSHRGPLPLGGPWEEGTKEALPWFVVTSSPCVIDARPWRRPVCRELFRF